MKSLLKSLILSLFAIGFFLSISPARAYLTKEDCQAADLSENPTNICKYGSNAMGGGVLYAFGTYINGPEGAQIEDRKETGAINYAKNSIAFYYETQPVATKIYIADVIKNVQHFGATPAYAQGVGFSGLNPVLEVWKAFRNLSYFLFILVFIGVGFMIMFRTQINHQAVVTAQLALPKIIITLVLITFSYAIAGLVIDSIYLLIYFMTSIFASAGLIGNVQAARDSLFNQSIWQLGNSLFVWESNQWSAATAFSQLLVGWNTSFHWVTDVLMWLILGLAILIALVRTFFQLLASYVAIIMSVVFAPLQLIPNAFPGNESFKGWIMNLLANAAVFPVVAAMILVGAALTGGNDATVGGIEMTSQEISNAGWTPPFIASTKTGPDSVRAILGIGLIMLLPTVGQITKQMFGVEANPFTGQVIGNIFSAPKMAMGGYQTGVGFIERNRHMAYLKGEITRQKTIDSQKVEKHPS